MVTATLHFEKVHFGCAIQIGEGSQLRRCTNSRPIEKGYKTARGCRRLHTLARQTQAGAQVFVKENKFGGPFSSRLQCRDGRSQVSPVAVHGSAALRVFESRCGK